MKVNTTNKKVLVILVSLILGVLLSFREIDLYFFTTWRYPESSSSILFLAFFTFIFFTSQSLALFWTNILWKKQHTFRKKILISLGVTFVFILFGTIVLILFNESSHFVNRMLSGRHQEFIDSIFSLILRSVSTFIILSGATWIYYLLNKKREAEKKYEALKIESLQSQLQALNNQINPHFFFNALNSLHSLILEDQKDKSLTYLSNLSNIFRYILQSEKKGLVKLKDELDFLEIYKETLFVKYEQRLEFDIDVDKRYHNFQIPVLSLLPIIENVSKHNEISNQFPMLVRIKTEDLKLVIRNNKHEKIDSVISDGVGLSNLNKRFKLLLNKEIVIEDLEYFYTVSLPLGEVQKSDK